MNPEKLLTIIKSIPYSNYENYGLLISRNDIFDACKAHDFNNSDLLTAMLENLENSGLIELSRMNDFDSKFIIGVKLK